MRLPKRVNFDPTKLTGFIKDLYRAIIIEEWGFNYFLTEQGTLLMASATTDIVILVTWVLNTENYLAKGQMSLLKPDTITVTFQNSREEFECKDIGEFISKMNTWAIKEANKRANKILDLFNFPHRQEPTKD